MFQGSKTTNIFYKYMTLLAHLTSCGNELTQEIKIIKQNRAYGDVKNASFYDNCCCTIPVTVWGLVGVKDVDNKKQTALF